MEQEQEQERKRRRMKNECVCVWVGARAMCTEERTRMEKICTDKGNQVIGYRAERQRTNWRPSFIITSRISIQPTQPPTQNSHRQNCMSEERVLKQAATFCLIFFMYKNKSINDARYRWRIGMYWNRMEWYCYAEEEYCTVYVIFW